MPSEAYLMVRSIPATLGRVSNHAHGPCGAILAHPLPAQPTLRAVLRPH